MTYPIVWWVLLPIVDEWNFRRRGRSLWRGRPRQFFLITIPLSVLLWLLYEALNLGSPQWRYRGGFQNIGGQVLFGFASFATVIPIIVEAYWLFADSFCLPRVNANKWLLLAIGLAVLSTPAYNDVFWLNQGMWLGPALLLLPFVEIAQCVSPRKLLLDLTLTGLVAGICWECLNYWAPTHWEYLILPNVPHLFEMPLPGYIGFIPFALTVLVVYEWQLRLKPAIAAGAALYGAALVLLYALTVVYNERGLWVVS